MKKMNHNNDKIHKTVHRSSNLELFRVLVMLAIIVHHYVVNSGLWDYTGPIFQNIHRMRSVFLLIIGAYGKIGINCFVLITGYFMCKSNISLRKFLKLYGEYIFYMLTIWFLFIFAGWSNFSVQTLLRYIVPFSSLTVDFSSCFFAFWLLIPFLNVLISGMTEQQHFLLAVFLLTILSVLPSLSYWLENSISFNYVNWFCVLYIVSSYLRLYPKAFLGNVNIWAVLSVVTILLSAGSVVWCAWYGNGIWVYYFVADCNKILAFATAFCTFNFFRILKIPYCRIINILGASTYGVLLIHAHSEEMRYWLWTEIVDCVGSYSFGKKLPIYCFASVVAIFLVCSCIDRLRIVCLEKPLLSLYDRWQNDKKSYAVSTDP